MRQSRLNIKNEERKQEINPKNGKPLTWQQYLRKHVLLSVFGEFVVVSNHEE